MTKVEHEDYLDNIDAAESVDELKDVLRDLVWELYKLDKGDKS